MVSSPTPYDLRLATIHALQTEDDGRRRTDDNRPLARPLLKYGRLKSYERKQRQGQNPMIKVASSVHFCVACVACFPLNGNRVLGLVRYI